MTTTMTFALAPRSTQLAAQPNSYVFALQYAGGQFVSRFLDRRWWPTPAWQHDHHPADPFSSGRVFILVQQNGDGAGADDQRPERRRRQRHQPDHRPAIRLPVPARRG